MPSTPEIFLNGIDLCGDPLLPAISRDELIAELRQSLLRSKEEFVPRAKVMRGLRGARAFFEELRPPQDPTRAGWALLLHKNSEARVRPLLEPLVAHRKSQMQGDAPVEVHVFDDQLTPEMWLRRNLVGAEHPYYMLIAASPEEIYIRFQQLLDVKCAVGRLWFDTDPEFKNYVDNILAAENGAPEEKPTAFLFAPDHDPATHLSRTQMADALASGLSAKFNIEYAAGDDATKGTLCDVLGSNQRKPGLVFTAGHGLAVPKTDPRQREMQGSLVCQDTRRAGYFGGADVEAGCNLPGGIFFSFACYGAGTPCRSSFWHWIQNPVWQSRLKMYEGATSFLAQLPTRLLGRPNGALAFVGHIDPAWTYSFLEPTTQEERIYPFSAALIRILQGAPVGYAVKEFNEEYATLNSDLLDKQIEYEEMTDRQQQPSPFWDAQLADTWMRRTDYQNYILLGDPAAKLNLV